MKIEFDPSKNAANIAKHGLSLSDAGLLDWGNAFIYPDVRYDYGEPRMIGLALMGNRLYTAVFVYRDGVRRMISLRKAHKKEVKTYVKNIHT